MGSPLAGQVAIVTGAGRGIGRAIAETLAATGASVVLAARSRDEIESVAAAIGAAGGTELAVPTDVTDGRSVANLAARTTGELGAPTLLVNNAGSLREIGPLEESDPDAWWGDVEVSLRGAFLCARAVLPSMLSAGSGRIVNVSSYAAIVPRPYMSGYAAGKAALASFSETLDAEVGGRGVRVFTISPGFVRTRLVEDVRGSERARAYAPDLAERDDALDPTLAARLVTDIASGRLDPLAGRFLHVLDDVDDLLHRADEIRDRDLYALRLHR